MAEQLPKPNGGSNAQVALSRVASDRTSGPSKMGTTENRIGLTVVVKANPPIHP